MKNWLQCICLGLLVFAVVASADQGISEPLRQEIESHGPDGWVSVNVILHDQVKLSYLLPKVEGMDPWTRRQYVVDYLRDFTESSQARIRGYLDAKMKTGDVERMTVLWMCNGLILDLKAYLIDELRVRFPEIQSIDLNAPIPVEYTIDPAPESGRDDLDDISWGVEDINAPDVWALGFNGEGILIGNLDTGVDITHPDLADRIWVNPGEDLNGNGTIDPSEINGIDDDGNGYIDDFYGWNFSANNNQVNDTNGHGTKTAGVVCGTGFGGEQTGVAPGATLMVLKNSGGGESSYWEAQQYAVANGARVITSSLSYKWRFNPKPNYAVFRQNAEMELAAGLVHSNSIGNEGDNQSTDPIPFNVSTPGNSPSGWLHPDQLLIGGTASLVAVGAFGSNHEIKNYSSVGPSSWYLDDILALAPTYPYQATWPTEYNDYPYQSGAQMALLKPDVCAPTDVQTTSIGGGYSAGFNGTSAATPHVGGCLCLLLSANPLLTPGECSEALQTTAREAGTPGKDNYYGAGMVDVYAAVLSILTDVGTVMGTVRDSVTAEPIALAQVAVQGTAVSTTTNDSGHYELLVWADSLVTLEASAFGYFSREAQATVAVGETLTVDFDLPISLQGTLAGWVLDQWGRPLEGAEVDVVEYPITPAVTDSIGYFELDLPSGQLFTINVTATGWETVTDQVILEEGQVLYRTYIMPLSEEAEPTGPDAYGYYAYDNIDVNELAPVYEWIEIDPNEGGPGTEIFMTEDDETQFFALPFDFTYYGMSYDSISVCGNGWIAMGIDDTTEFSNSPIPDPDGPEAMVAPFWEDLSPQDTMGTISYAYLAQEHVYIVEWNGVRQWTPVSALETFQVIFYDPQYYPTPTGDGEIMFQYAQVSDPTECTIGIEDSTETMGLQLLWDNVYAPTTPTLSAERAIYITTRTSEAVTGAISGNVILDGPGSVEDAQVFAGIYTTNPASNGDYVLTELLPGLVQATARAYGYVDSSMWVEVIAGDTLEGIDFTLDYLPTPSNLVGTLVDPTVRLEWSACDTTGLPQWDFIGYSIYRDDVVLDSTVTDSAYVDTLTESGIFEYYIRARFAQGTSDSTNHVSVEFTSDVGRDKFTHIPAEPYLAQNYPNPFNPSTYIRFGVTEIGRYRMEVYNVLGRRVTVLMDGNLVPGHYRVNWDADIYPSGMYFYRLESPSGTQFVRKMLLIK